MALETNMAHTTYDWERFDAHIKETVRARLDCRAVVADAGLVKKRGSGRYVKIHCVDPSHEDNHPSCSVGPDGFKCHACGASGDVFTLVGLLQHVDSFSERVRAAARLAGVDYDAERDRFVAAERDATWRSSSYETIEIHASRDLSEYRRDEVVDNFDDLVSPEPDGRDGKDPDEPLAGRSGVRAQVWHELVSRLSLDGPGAEYLEARGISRQLARALGVRYADPDTWRDALRHAWRTHGARSLDAAGVLGRDAAHEHVPHPGCYGGALVFTYSGGASPESLRFRNLDPDASIRYLSLRGPHNQPRVAYLSDLAHRPLLGASPGRALYVTEGEINALSLAAVGRACVGLPGADSWRPEWAYGFADFDRVVLLLDGDRASEQLARSILTSCSDLYGDEWTQRRVRPHLLTDGDGTILDANDALMGGSLEDLLRRAEDLSPRPE